MPIPDAGGKLGGRFQGWLEKLAPWVWIKNYSASIRKRKAQIATTLPVVVKRYMAQGDFQNALVATFLGWFYVYIGEPAPILEEAAEFTQMMSGITATSVGQANLLFSALVKQGATDPATRAVTEMIGSIITEPVVNLLEEYALKPNPDPHAFAKSFHGIASGLPWSASMIDSVLKTVLGERAPQVGQHVMSLYWGLGLGFLGWQTLAPLLSSGLQPNLERYYNRLYRPARFSPAQASDLYALGRYSGNDIRGTLREQGWRDEDIQNWIDLSFKTLPESVCWDLYYKGHITKSQMDTRLRALGYSPADIPLVYKANDRDDTPTVLASTAKAAYKDKIISEGEFRQLLAALKYSQREVDLQAQIVQSDWVTDNKRLTVGQLKAAYNSAQLTRAEVKNALRGLQYTTEDAETLIGTWIVEARPKAKTLNQSTITQGFSDGVLDKAAAIQMLQDECGYDKSRATLVIRIVEADNPSQVVIGPGGAKAATLEQLTAWYRNGLLSKQSLLERPELDVYAEQDIVRIVTMITAPAVKDVAQLSKADILEAYVYGVLDSADVKKLLMGIGFSKADAETLMQTTSAQYPERFGQVTTEATTALTVAQITDMAAAGLLTRKQVEARSELSSYTAGDRAKLVDLIFEQVTEQPLELSDDMLVTAWVYEVITEDQLRARLTARNVQQADLDILVATTKLQYPARFGVTPTALQKQPSVAAVTQAYQRGLIDEAGFRYRLASLGYTVDGIELLLTNASYDEPQEPRELTQSQVSRLFRDSLISRSEAEERLQKMGYLVRDIKLLLDMEQQGILYHEAVRWLKAGLLTPTGAAAILTDDGYTTTQISDVFADLGYFATG